MLLLAGCVKIIKSTLPVPSTAEIELHSSCSHLALLVSPHTGGAVLSRSGVLTKTQSAPVEVI